MRSKFRLGAGVATFAVLLAGCGTQDNLAGKTPAQIITNASTNAQAASQRADFTASLVFDKSQLQGSVGPYQNALSGLSVAGHVDVKDANNSQGNITVTVGSKNIKFYFITTGGQSYVSTDGQTYGPGTPDSSSSSSASTQQLTTFLNSLGTSLKDLGSQSKDGVDTHHLQLMTDAATISSILGSNPSTAQVATLVSQLLTFNSGSVDIWVKQDTGNFVHFTANPNVTLNVDQVMSLLSSFVSSTGVTVSGKLGITLNVDAKLFGYGDNISISAPTNINPAAPTPDVSSLFS